jgi:hypothetical protein
MARQLSPQDITWFLDLHDKGQLDLSPPYQRKSVWSPRDKRFFIDTILNGYPAPPVFLHKTLDANGRPTYHVVDGKQRLQTVIDFRDNKIRIPDDFSDVALQKKRWSDLQRDSKEKFWNYSIVVEMLPSVEESAIRNIFERINRNSRKLTNQEMRHARYDGWYITFVEGEVEKPFWREVGLVTTARSKRMADAQFLSELFAVNLKQKIQAFDQDSIDELYAEYEELSEVGDFSEENFLTDIDNVKEKLKNILTEAPELLPFYKTQAHLYSLWSFITLELERVKLTQGISGKYLAFLKDVTAEIREPTQLPEGAVPDVRLVAVRRYAAAARGATTDLTPRRERHHGLIEALL